MARSGIWRICEQSIRLPAIAFVHAKRIQAPEYAELLLSRGSESKPTLTDEGSVFLPSLAEGEITIPPDFPLPMSLRDLETNLERKGEGKAVVVHLGRLDSAREGAKQCLDLFVMGNAVQLIRHPKEFAEEITTLRNSVGYRSLIYIPGIATPTNLSLLCYCGGDIFDSTRVVWESRSGHKLTPEGRWPQPHSGNISCECSICTGERTFETLLEHNYLTLIEELERTRHHIRKGTLREFVEKRSVHDPWMIAVLRHLDLRFYDHQELHFPISGARFSANTRESLFRPDIARFRRRIRERYQKPKSGRVLLLLPCSARKPYSLSSSHSLFRRAVRKSGAQHLIHEVILTSPLGIVPRELELFYPAQHYDIPVTGDWSRDEISILQEELLVYLKRNEYEHIIVHLGPEMDFVLEVLEECISTSNGVPTSPRCLSKLREELTRIGREYPIASNEERRVEEMLSRCVFQFGEGGKELMNSSVVRGRYPNLRIISEGRQLGMITRERGMISLTLGGGGRISERNAYCVEIEDFYLDGNLFAVGVLDASREIRVGDEVVIRHEKDVRGVGIALMNWKEMIESDRGEAVRVRHRVSPEE